MNRPPRGTNCPSSQDNSWVFRLAMADAGVVLAKPNPLLLPQTRVAPVALPAPCLAMGGKTEGGDLGRPGLVTLLGTMPLLLPLPRMAGVETGTTKVMALLPVALGTVFLQRQVLPRPHNGTNRPGLVGPFQPILPAEGLGACGNACTVLLGSHLIPSFSRMTVSLEMIWYGSQPYSRLISLINWEVASSALLAAKSRALSPLPQAENLKLHCL